MMKKTTKAISTEARLEAKLRSLGNSKSELDRKYKAIQDDNEKLQKALNDALAITSYRPKPFSIQAPKNNSLGEATMVACLSDVHCDELVPKHKVNYLGEHTPEISKKRLSKFFELVVRFLRVDRKETNINNLILWLGGDFFTSSESHGSPVAFPTMVAVMYAQEMIFSGIKFLLTQEPKLQIHIVGSVGNHSRKESHKPVNVALEQELSLEWAMYHSLKQMFTNEKRITWTLDNSYNTYVRVYDKIIRFNHGHLGWRYNDGLAGVHGPLWKWITQKANNQVKADLTVCGHYHQWTPASLARPYLVNGSTIGISPYGLGFGFEPPSQMLFLLHDKYGLVNQRPLFVDQ